jgi:hypothetical protein
MQFRSKLFQRRAAAAGATLNKIYDVYMTPDGHFVAGEQEDGVGRGKKAERSRPGESLPLPKK